ncbi:MAG: hypothetical protein WEB60_01155 [Terrimicrobiaceae bacterium]
MKTVRILGEPSFEIHSDLVSAALTRDGGQLGPVEFVLGKKTVRPFHAAPWAGSKEAKGLPPILRALRGDFFCMPFGGNGTAWKNEKHPVHGETANNRWEFQTADIKGHWTGLQSMLKTSVRPATVTKLIALHAGHTAVYSRHVVSGGSGPMNFGHHAMLAFDSEPGNISTSRFVRGQVFPGEFEKAAEGGYSSLKPGATFTTLAKVPAADGSLADLSSYPARDGFEDLVMISSKPGTTFGWTAVTFPKGRYVWFSLKDPRVLASTVLWHSNGGRHYPPWNGRHRRVLGLEDVTSYFHYGLAESAAPNDVSRAGIPTHMMLSPKQPLVVNTILGVAAIPVGFDRVKSITPGDDGILLESENGKSARAKVDTSFLYGKDTF